MRHSKTSKQSASERIVKDIKRKTRKQYSAEKKIRIVLDGLRGEESIVNYAAKKVLHRSCTINGRKIFWRLAKNVLLATSFKGAVFIIPDYEHFSVSFEDLKV